MPRQKNETTMHKDSRIYIAGHLGMVGSAIHRKLRSEGHHDFVLRSFEDLDLRRQEQVEDFFQAERPDYVIVAAAKVGGIVANDTYRAEFIYENLMIQNNIIHAAWQHGVKKLLFLGSSCIYPKNAPQPIKEDYLLTGVLEPTNEPYAIAKIAGIKMCESYYRQYGCEFISVMPTNLYGPNDNYNLETSHVLPALIRKMHLAKCLENNDWQSIREDLVKRPLDQTHREVEKQWSEKELINLLEKRGITCKNDAALQDSGSPVRLTLWGSGKVYREFLHVDDMADACVHIMQHVSAETLYTQLKQTHINIGTGKDLAIKDLAEKTKNIVGFRGNIQWDQSKPDGTPKKQLDVSLLNNLGWQPTIGLEKGIDNVYKHYLAEE